MEVKEVFSDISVLKQWCLVNSNKIGRAVSRSADGKFEHVYQDNGCFKGIETADPEHTYWLTYEEAKQALSDVSADGECSGIGMIVFTPVAVVDLDDCFVDGELNAISRYILDLMPDTFVEKSKSGRGLHVYCRYSGSNMLAGRPKDTADGKIEVYTEHKLVVITGKSFGEVKPLVDHTAEIDRLVKEYYPEKLGKYKSDYQPTFFDNTSTATVLVDGRACYVHDLDQNNKRLLDSYLQKAVNSEIDFIAHNCEGSRHTDLLIHVTQLGKLSAYFTVDQKQTIMDTLEAAYVSNNTGYRDERDLARHFQRTFEKAWMKGESEKPRVISLTNGHKQKTNVERLKVSYNVPYFDDGEMLSFIHHCWNEGRSHSEAIAKYFQIHEMNILNRLNIGYFNGIWCSDKIPVKGEAYTLPCYSAKNSLVGVYVFSGDNMPYIGDDSSIWFEGFDRDTVVLTDGIREAIYLSDNLGVTTVAVGSCVDNQSYDRISASKRIVAFGTKMFLTKAMNTFGSVVPVDVEALRTKGGKLYKWLEAILRKLGTAFGDVYVHLSGKVTRDYEEFSKCDEKNLLVLNGCRLENYYHLSQRFNNHQMELPNADDNRELQRLNEINAFLHELQSLDGECRKFAEEVVENWDYFTQKPKIGSRVIEKGKSQIERVMEAYQNCLAKYDIEPAALNEFVDVLQWYRCPKKS